MSTTVFDVVHMFSERGISAVPIIDENGIVVNLYETVDVIVSIYFAIYAMHASDSCTDSGPSGGIPSARLDDCRGSEPTIA
jgi:CBS domain-containing protein